MLLRALILLMTAALLEAQVRMEGGGVGGKVVLVPSDSAVLELQEPRQDLPCNVAPLEPILGFDLRYHSGYNVIIPLRYLAGSENSLSILFRVIPEGRETKPVYFLQHVQVPSLAEDSRGEAAVQGMFDLGEGKYHVDWLMRDRTERVCSSYWDLQVDLPDSENERVKLTLKPGEVRETEGELFAEEPPVPRAQDDALLHVKVLVNFAPQRSESTTMRPLDTQTLVSVLRSISRNPQMGKFSLVAFNMQQRRVFYRQDAADRIDFPSLGRALKSVDPATIDLQRLAQSETDFLEDLIEKETGDQDHPDALVFVGPKAMLAENVPKEKLRQITNLDYPIFYMNCNLYPQRMPWRDTIGNVVKFFKGTEYMISQPRDVWFAAKDLVARILKYKQSNPRVPPSSD